MPKLIKNANSHKLSKGDEKSYLDRLTYDPKQDESLVGKYIRNFRMVTLLLLSILLVGIVSYFQLPQRLNPEIHIPIVIVTTVLPGAAPEDVESLLSVPLENEINSVKGIDQVNSVSRESLSIISIQFVSGVDAEKAKTDVQSAIDNVDLPEEANDPVAKALDFEDQPIWSFAVRSKSDVASLMSFTKNLRQIIEDLPEIDRVITAGFETQEIGVTVNPEKIVQYNLNPLGLADQLKNGSQAFPAGTIKTDRYSYSFTIDPGVSSVQDIRNLKVEMPGGTTTLGEIAVIEEKSKSDQNVAFLSRPGESLDRIVTVYVYKTTGTNINEAGEAVKVVVDKEMENYKDRFELISIMNTSEEIRTQFTDLLGEFRSTMILVFICLLLFLGLRQALISLLTVPLTFLSAFIIMHAFGMSINFLSLFAFLLSLGLLVDDTIVVVSAMTRYYRTGRFTPHQTGVLVWRDTIVPIWSTTITTIWSFVPLLLSTGIIGEFIKPIPVVVTATMVSSTAISVLITLPLMIILLKPNLPARVVWLFRILLILVGLGVLALVLPRNGWLIGGAVVYGLIIAVWTIARENLGRSWRQQARQQELLGRVGAVWDRVSNRGLIDIEVLADKYRRLMDRILQSRSAMRKVIWGIVIYALVSFVLLPLGLVKNEFFPKSDAEVMYVNVELPAGASLEKSKEVGNEILEQISQTPEAEFIVMETGRSIDQNGEPAEGSNLVQFTMHFPEVKKQKIGSIEIAERLRQQFSGYTRATVSVIEISGGPPAGADVQIKLLGNDLGVLNQKADELIGFLNQQPGITNPKKSILPGTSKLVFVPDAQKLLDAGVRRDSLGFWMRTFASDLTLDSVDFDKEDKTQEDVVLKLGTESKSPEKISELMVPTMAGGHVPLLSLGKLEAKPNPTVITREDFTRTMSVSAGVRKGYAVSEANSSLIKFAESMEWSVGYSWATGGVNEENQKSVNSILQAMGLAFLLILVTMVVQFNSFRQALIVLMVIPLAVSSVFYAFGLTGTPLSFPALIGILSLFGIVVTNSMFIVDKINLNLKEGLPFRQAVATAGSSRLEPIVLTKLATVLGLLPITLADPLWRGLGGAIISGLLIASFIMLFFIPVVYYQWFGPKEN